MAITKVNTELLQGMFRRNSQTLAQDTTIAADENASCTGPLEVETGVVLTVTAGGNLSIV